MFPLNLPNALTLLRILAVPVVVVALLGETPNGDALAAAVFAWLLHGPGRAMERLIAIDVRGRFADGLYAKLMALPLPWHEQLGFPAGQVALEPLDSTMV